MNAPARFDHTPRKARLRVEDYLLLDESGAFAAYSKTELIEGEIYYVNAQHSRHSRIKSLLVTEFNIALRALGSELEAWSEVATRLPSDSMPEPDVILTSFRGRGPVPLETVPLVVEVSDTSLAFDIDVKQRIYARAGIAEYWIADAERERIVRMWQPRGDEYTRRDEAAFGATVASVTLEGLWIDTSSLLD